MIAFHFDPHILPLPAGHRFPIGKYGLLRRRVEAYATGFYRKREAWFEKPATPHFVMWWVEKGHRPDLKEAAERLALDTLAARAEPREVKRQIEQLQRE